MASLAECLCAELCEDGPEPCFCGVLPGDAYIAEYVGNCADKCGSAWVRLVAAYPSVTAGQPDQEVRRCGTSLGLEIEVGVLRCAPAPDSRGEPPPPGAVLAAADQQFADMILMRKVISCCPELQAFDYVLGTYTPAGPQGGLVGGLWTVGVAF